MEILDKKPNYAISVNINCLDKDTNESTQLVGREQDEKSYDSILFVGLTNTGDGVKMHCVIQGMCDADLLNIFHNEETLARAARRYTIFSGLARKGEGANAPS